MSTLSAAYAAERLFKDHPAWALLRGRNAAAAVALLGAHLAGDSRRRPAPELFDLIEDDLQNLRDHGFDLPQTSQAYCSEWRTEGILIRRASEEARGETFELSQGALTAIQFVSQLAEPRQAVTESRLSSIFSSLRQLAQDTDPSSASRLDALRAEQERLAAEIERVQAGDFEVLDTGRALERVKELLLLADEIPSDFSRVRAELELINRNLRERLISQQGSRGTVLEDIFRGVDHLSESDAGRSFNGFFSLILDPEQSAEFEVSVGNVLDRDFAGELTPRQTRFLRRLLPSLQDSSGEIHEVMTNLSRSLRRFVQSQELEEDRKINSLLRDTLREGVELSRTVRVWQSTSLDLDLTSMPLGSISAFSLHNPADSETVAGIVTREPEPVDLRELRALARASEIDMKELVSNVNAVFDRRGAATIADILDARPATQGVASVVGLLVLAEAQGRLLDGDEPVTWHSSQGIARYGVVPRYLFTRRIT
ncbi:hypothetical protein IWX64_002291 [Arthrobacter sp. CAN_A212]|uniref:DUF3375 domain-containing protein n=1 Tax=unclassified Arthrobacter TaxID=235627 RepID=UPI0018CB1C33|nr:DUF3375 domain-containing protein [Arthrobacter sp. CAN_C5]MBP2217981.1 hypothetical protein [Arthrobacter sp. CAN_C5]